MQFPGDVNWFDEKFQQLMFKIKEVAVGKVMKRGIPEDLEWLVVQGQEQVGEAQGEHAGLLEAIHSHCCLALYGVGISGPELNREPQCTVCQPVLQHASLGSLGQAQYFWTSQNSMHDFDQSVAKPVGAEM